jgi:hypothetical protein
MKFKIDKINYVIICDYDAVEYEGKLPEPVPYNTIITLNSPFEPSAAHWKSGSNT